MRKLATLVSILLVLVLVAGFATTGMASVEDAKGSLTKYDEPVTITVGRMNNAGGQYAAGRTPRTTHGRRCSRMS